MMKKISRYIVTVLLIGGIMACATPEKPKILSSVAPNKPEVYSPAAENERPEIFVQLGHSTVISSVAFSPDGRYAITGGLDTTMKLWDIETGREVRTFAGHADRVDAVAYSPNGRYAISGHYIGRMKLWDVVTGKELRTFSERSNNVLSVAFSPNGQYILSGGWDKTLKLWDVATGMELRNFAGHSDKVSSVAFSPDGRYILSGSWDKTLNLWDMVAGRELRTFSGHSDKVSSVVFSPDGRHILSGSLDNTMKIWDVTTGKELRSFGYPKPVILPSTNIDTGRSNFMAVAFSPDGKQIISGGGGYILKLWDVETGGELRTYDGRIPLFGNSVTSVAFSPDGRYILSAGYDKAPKLWEVSTGKILHSFGGSSLIFSNGVNHVAFSPDIRYILVSNGKTQKLWEIATGREIRTFTKHSEDLSKDFLNNAVFSPDGQHILTVGSDKTLRLWNVTTGRELRTFAENSAGFPVAFSPDGRYILSGSGSVDKTLKLWDVATGKILRTFAGHSDAVFSVAFSPDGRYVLSGSEDKTLKLWDVATGRELRTFIGHSKWIFTVAFSPDGRYVLSGSVDKTLKLWDVETGRILRTFMGHSASINSVAFSPDGRYIISGSDEGEIKQWDMATGRELRTFVGHSARVCSVAFSLDGRYIISGSDDQTTILWDVSKGAEIASMISFSDGEWIAITPEGYYNSSLYGHKYLNIRQGLRVFGIDQFYDVFYRPDIVTAKLRGENISDLITLTIDDAIKSPPPVVEFTSIPKDINKAKAKVCYQVKNMGGGIGEVRLFHNGKLIQSDGFYKDIAKIPREKTQLLALNSKTIYEDLRSVKITNKEDISPITSKEKGDVFQDCAEIDAIPGENEVSVTAFNGNNTIQSYMQTAIFNSMAESEEPHLYILSIGINQYKDNNVNLKYAVKDSRDIQAKFIKQATTIYSPQNIHHSILTDKDATKSNIVGKINELSQQIKPTDGFIIFVAGHGVLLQNQYYMLTQNYDGNLNETTLISSNEIVEMSKKIKALSQLFIFDTCHAGGVDTIVSGLYDARMSVLAKKMGLHIYASASDKQAAMDGYKGNGLFTYALLDGLNNNKEADKNKDGKVSIVGLGEYSRKMTTNISKQIGHEQTPLIINFGKDSTIYKLQ
jgi:WD40 repeat protein